MRRIFLLLGLALAAGHPALAEAPDWSESPEAVQELAMRSRIPLAELRVVIADCELTQRSMNLCAFGRAIWAELRFDEAVAATGRQTPTELSVWKAALQARCETEGDEVAKGGSSRPMVISRCKELGFLAERVRVVGLENFPAPPQPPHKWRRPEDAPTD